MTVLITGGLGHIGAHVAAELMSRGIRVIAFDENASKFDERATDQLREMREKLVLEAGSVTDFDRVKAVFEPYENQIDCVVHLAGLGGVEDFVREPRQSVYLNVVGTLNVLEACRLAAVKRFVYVSSGAVYGRRDGILREGDECRADDLYGASKISGELLTSQYGRSYGMEYCSARVYFVYGPGRMPSSMYPLYRGLFGPLEGIDSEMPDIRPDQELDFTHIDDTAQGIARICMHRERLSPVYNIASGRACRIGDVARTAREWSGMGEGLPQGGDKYLMRGAPLDISLAQKELGYKPKYADIREGIQSYGNWIKRQHSGQSR